MKLILFLGLILINVSACNRSNDEMTIERQEDYERNDVRDIRNVPLETEDEFEVDRDVMGDDENEIDD